MERMTNLSAGGDLQHEQLSQNNSNPGKRGSISEVKSSGKRGSVGEVKFNKTKRGSVGDIQGKNNTRL